MADSIRPGVYPTMITPFTEDNRIDYGAVEQLIEYYVANGCDGIFAICQSSEMFFMTDEEKRELMRFITRRAAGRLQLVASGHTADDEATQIRQLQDMAEAGAEASVIVLNRLAGPEEGEDILKARLERLIEALPGLTLGIYECPYPYKRMFTDALLAWCAKTGRIVFIKDTCCNLETLRRRQSLVANTPLSIYNANSTTLLDSMRAGIQGYSGIMANFHPDLYAALFALHAKQDPRADPLQQFLSLASLIEYQLYPVNAKAHLRQIGIDMSLVTRAKDYRLWTPTFEAEVSALVSMENLIRNHLGLVK